MSLNVPRRADAAFIANAPTDIAALLVLLGEAREALRAKCSLCARGERRLPAHGMNPATHVRGGGQLFCGLSNKEAALLSRLPAPEEPA